MKSLKLMLLIAVGQLVLTGCFESSSSKKETVKTQTGFVQAKTSSGGTVSKSSSSNSDLESQDPFEGKTPEEYYSQFILHTEGECGASENFMMYIYPRTDEIRVMVNGELERTFMSIVMGPDHRYRAIYEEGPVLTRKIKIAGRWKVEGSDLIFENLGAARATVHNRLAGFLLRFDRNLHSQGLRDSVVPFWNWMSDHPEFPDLKKCN